VKNPNLSINLLNELINMTHINNYENFDPNDCELMVSLCNYIQDKYDKICNGDRFTMEPTNAIMFIELQHLLDLFIKNVQDI